VVLAATSYEQACALSARAAGRRLSVQTWNIVDRIRALDAVLTPDLQRRVVEVHPEVSFAALTGAPLAAPKKVAAGRAAREAALAGWFAELGIPVTAVTAPRGTPGRPDDRLDALACAWSALRWARGIADVLPGGRLGDPPRDSRGLRCEIVV
jgi:predicted RNase H-like nuclease